MTNATELEQFHNYASARLANGGADLTLEELLSQYRAAREREEANEGIRRGLRDLAEGKHRPAEEVMAEAYRRLER